MIPLLVALSLLNPIVEAPLGNFNVKDLKELLVESGYTISKQQNENMFDITRKNHKGSRSLSCSSMSIGSSSTPSRPISILTFEADYAVSKNLDVLPPYLLKTKPTPHVKTTLQNHLYKVVSATSEIRDIPEITRTELVRAINFVWDSIDRHAKSRFDETAPQPQKIDSGVDNKLLAYPDKISLWCLVYYWGWEAKFASGGSSPGWIIPASLGPFRGWLREGNQSPTGGKPASFYIEIDLDNVSPERRKWLSENQSRYSWATMLSSRQPDGVTCRIGILLTPTTTVADVKKQIQTIIDQMKGLEKDLK